MLGDNSSLAFFGGKTPFLLNQTLFVAITRVRKGFDGRERGRRAGKHPRSAHLGTGARDTGCSSRRSRSGVERADSAASCTRAAVALPVAADRSSRCAKFASKTGALFPHALRGARALRSRQMTESDRAFTCDVVVDDRTRVLQAVATSDRAIEEK